MCVWVSVLHEVCFPAWENQWDQCYRDKPINICTHAHAHPSHRHDAVPHTYTICAHFLTHCSTSLRSLCTQSRILMCSLRALLSACVTFNPFTHHFRAHHQTERKRFSTKSPFIQLLHGLRQYSISYSPYYDEELRRCTVSLRFISWSQ